MMGTIRNTIAIAFLMAASTSPIARAGSKVYVGSQVPANRQVTMNRIDHSVWDALLRKYVDADRMVNYRALKASSGDMQALDGYLATLSAAGPQIRSDGTSHKPI